jgi:hypothetical protein
MFSYIHIQSINQSINHVPNLERIKLAAVSPFNVAQLGYEKSEQANQYFACITQTQGCQILLGTTFQNGKIYNK